MGVLQNVIQRQALDGYYKVYNSYRPNLGHQFLGAAILQQIINST